MLKKGLLLLFVLLFIATSVSALEASIGRPRMILYKNVTQEEPLVFENSVIVQNKNDYRVEIVLEPVDDLVGHIDIHEPEFVLGAKDERESLYDVTIEKPGLYNGGVIVKFNKLDDKSVGAALVQRVIVSVKGEGDFEEEPIEEEEKKEESEEEPEVEVIGEKEMEEVRVTEGPITGNVVSEEIGESGPSVLIGILIIIGVMLVGILVYSLIFMRGAKK